VLAHRAAITCVAVNRARSLLATSSLDGHVKVWRANDAREVKDLHVGPVESWAVAFEESDAVAAAADDTTSDADSVDGIRVASTCQSGAAAINVWALATGEKAASYGGAHASGTNVTLAYSPNGRLVATGAMDGTVSLFEAGSGVKRHTFQAHAMPVRTLQFSADSATLITGSDDCQIRIHDVEQCAPILSLSGHTSWVLSIASSPDRKRFASGSADKSVCVWDTGNPQPLHVFTEHADKVWCVAWTNNATRIVSGSDDSTLCVFSAPL